MKSTGSIALRREAAGPATLASLGVEALVLPAQTSVMEIDELFRTERGLRAVAIKDGHGHARARPSSTSPGQRGSFRS